MMDDTRLEQDTFQKCASENQNEEYVLCSNYFYILQMKPEVNLSTDIKFETQAIFLVGLFCSFIAQKLILGRCNNSEIFHFIKES